MRPTNRRPSLVMLALSSVLLLPACALHGEASLQAEAEAPAFVFVEPPMLVAVSPGVWVVQDYHAQIFYVSGAYWHLHGGVWYRADTYDGSWVAVRPITVPLLIRGEAEGHYAYYSGGGDAKRKQAPPSHAAAKHGGPPGHRDEPGLRLGQRDRDDEPDRGDDEPGRSEDAPGHADDERDRGRHEGPPAHADAKGARHGKGHGPK